MERNSAFTRVFNALCDIRDKCWFRISLTLNAGYELVGTAHHRLLLLQYGARRLCPPYKPLYFR